MRRSIVFALLAAGCVPTSYTYSPMTKGEVPRQPGPDGCAFTVHTSPPEEGYQEIGTFKHYNGDVPTDEAALKKALAERVCEVGGHAVIVQRAADGGYQTATVIQYSTGFHM